MYRMRAFDQTLVQYVYWNSSVIDNTGLDYIGPGPLVDIVVTLTDAGDLVSVGNEAFINLIGSHNDVDLWSGGPKTSWVEVDLVGGGGATLTGIDSTGFKFGNILWLWNGGGGSVFPGGDILTLTNQDTASLANNRIWVPNGKSLNIPNNDGIALIYVGNSWTVFCGSASMVRAQELSLDPSVQPTALLNGNTYDDLNPWAGAGPFTSYVKQDTGLLATVTGIDAAGAPNSEGRVLVYQNISTTGTILIKHNNVGSIAANRILCPRGLDVSLGPLCSVLMIYDDAVEMWRVVAAPPAPDTSQRFVVSRQIGDTGILTIDASRGFLGRASLSYTVQATMGKNSLAVGIQEIDPGNFSTTEFVVTLTSAWAAGDSIMFTVEDLS